MKQILSKLHDKLRTMAGIRAERELLPAGEKPLIGTSIVRDKLRMRLKYPITDELWKWLTTMGWRAIDMRDNRRRYIVVPDKILIKLIKANTLERYSLHNRLLKATSVERHTRETTLNVPGMQKKNEYPEWKVDTIRQ